MFRPFRQEHHGRYAEYTLTGQRYAFALPDGYGDAEMEARGLHFQP